MIIIFPVNWPRSRYPGHAETTKIDYFAADVRGNAALKICSEKFANVLSEI